MTDILLSLKNNITIKQDVTAYDILEANPAPISENSLISIGVKVKVAIKPTKDDIVLI